MQHKSVRSDMGLSKLCLHSPGQRIYSKYLRFILLCTHDNRKHYSNSHQLPPHPFRARSSLNTLRVVERLFPSGCINLCIWYILFNAPEIKKREDMLAKAYSFTTNKWEYLFVASLFVQMRLRLNLGSR